MSPRHLTHWQTSVGTTDLILLLLLTTQTTQQYETFIQSGSDLKTIINWCYARAMFWVKIKTVFNLNFIPQAINQDVYCWFFKIFYVNTDPDHALFICSELLEFSLLSNHPQSSEYFISKSFTPEMVLPDSWPLSALSRHYVLFHYDFTILCKCLEKMSEMPAWICI